MMIRDMNDRTGLKSEEIKTGSKLGARAAAALAALPFWLFSVGMIGTLAGCTAETGLGSKDNEPAEYKEYVSAQTVAEISVDEALKDKTESGNVFTDYEHFDDADIEGFTNTFEWRFYDTLNHDENCLYSVYGLEQALGLLLNGVSDEETIKPVLNAFGFKNLKEFNSYFHVVNGYFLGNEESQFNCGNLLLVDSRGSENLSFDEDYFSFIREVYNGSAEIVDFKDSNDLKDRFDRWLSNSTNGYMTDLGMTKGMNSGIFNAVYFKGLWDEGFDHEALAEFKDKNGVNKVVNMICGSRSVLYHEDEKYRGIMIPFVGENGLYFSACFVIPADGSSNMAESWASESVNYRIQFMKDLALGYREDLDIRFPETGIEVEHHLNENFKKMGLLSLFNDSAEVDRLLSGRLVGITDISHQTCIYMNKDGMFPYRKDNRSYSASDILESESVGSFICDVPFLFTIRDDRYGIDIFTGFVNNV